MKKIIATVGFCLVGPALAAVAQANAPLKLVTKYDMPVEIKGRFDHLAADLKGNRLFLAAEGAHQVLVFNLHDGKFLHSISGIDIPHAIFVREDLDRIYITDGGPGALRIYDGKTYQLLKTVPLKPDADSIGYDAQTHYLYIDNGGGDAHDAFSMLSIVDTTSGDKIADVKIDGDTLEAMALPKSGSTMYVTNRALGQVAVFDRKARSVVTSWPITMGKTNVAMALDEANNRLFVGARSGSVIVFDTQTGKELQSLPIAKNIDELIFDPTSKRIYASCAAGSTSVYYQQDPDHYKLLAEVPTGPGAKNELLIPRLKRYFVVVPPQANSRGQVYVYQVQ